MAEAGQLPLDYTMDTLEMRVVCTLRAHHGRERAIGVDELAAAVGTSPRDVQAVVHRLRCEHGVPIASTAAKPAGYFVPETSEEIEKFYREQRAKALGTLAAAAAVKRIALPELLGQIALEISKFEFRNSKLGAA